MIILGIDPGFARLGYGVIEYENNKYKTLEYGSITTKAGERLSLRLKRIGEDLQSIVSKYNIDAASIEDLFFNTNITTGIQVAEARGVIMYVLESNNIPIAEYTPLQVKQALVGYGRADKHQIMDMVKRILKLEKMPKLDDTADALAIAICHSYSYKYNQVMKKKK